MSNTDPTKTPPPERPQNQPERPPLRYYHMRGEYDKPIEPPKPMPWWRALWLRITGR